MPPAAEDLPRDLPLPPEEDLRRAAEAIRRADLLVITAGAGMGVDSGLPDFRGPEGFWRAYPAIAKLGLRFEEMANPAWFDRDPTLAWGFYGHRMNLYRRTRPHAGFGILLGWNRPGWVFTSNIDGHFAVAGFDPARIIECHGSIRHLQCVDPRCRAPIRPADDLEVTVDEATLRAAEPLPKCDRCGKLARPNVLMFSDDGWRSERRVAQEDAVASQLESLGDSRVTVVELGAGSAVPTVRAYSEGLLQAGASLVRINVREPEVPPVRRAIGLACGALATLTALDPLVRAE